MFVYTSGKIDNFCSSKCEKHTLQLKRKPIKTRWTQASQTERQRSKK